MEGDLFHTPSAQPLDEAFEDFWEAYPRKVGKGAARKAFKKALSVTTIDDIMFGLSQQIEGLSTKEKQFIPHASTWLHGERWNDEPERIDGVGGGCANGNARDSEITFAAAARRTPSKDSF